MGLCRFADMQGCAKRLGDGRVLGIWLCGSDGYAPSRGFVVFIPMPTGIGYWFYGFFYTLCNYAYRSLRFIEDEVLWTTEDHGRVLNGD